MSKRRSTHPHPGKVLLEQFLSPLGISQNALARAAGVTPHRINEIVLGKRRITADSAIRLGAALGTTGNYWLSLQSEFDLEEAQRAIGRQISRIERLTS
ncbi:HigA family addiction module antitoxin [Frateuria aurantia]